MSSAYLVKVGASKVKKPNLRPPTSLPPADAGTVSYGRHRERRLISKTPPFKRQDTWPAIISCIDIYTQARMDGASLEQRYALECFKDAD